MNTTLSLSPQEAGTARFVEQRSSVLARWSVGIFLTTFAIAAASAGTLFASLDRAHSPFLIFAVAFGGLSPLGLFAAAIQRRSVVYDHGFTIPRVRARELFRRTWVLPYEAVASVSLLKPGRDWVWRIHTRDGRRVAIPEWKFREKSALHEFLLAKWPQAKAA